MSDPRPIPGTVRARAAAHVVAGGRTFPLEADRIHVLGSGEKADVRLVHASVAPAHATLCAHDGRLLLQDLGTSAGTRVDGELLHGEREVRSGSTVMLGEVQLTVTIGPSPLAVVSRAAAGPSFGALMADELRRAPWLGLSAMLHALLFLLLYLLMPAERPPMRRVLQVEMLDGDPQSAEVVRTEAIEHEIVVPDPAAPTEELAVEPAPNFEAESRRFAAATEPPPAPMSGVADLGAELFAPIGGGGRGDVLASLGATGAGGTAGFRRAVSGLRQTGLEIVFVLDTTGSMGPVLEGTKRRLVRMLEALHALVPDSRVGIVAYRDRGAGEAYLTRDLQLGRDHYRSLNFMQTVSAAGGGDRPEAVLDALKAAAQQRWRDGAKRVIVVIGDAPAHDWSKREIEQLVEHFVRDGKGVVHTIATAADVFGDVREDTKESFERIAKAGNGAFVAGEREDTILRQVLSLAIGPEFRENVDEVFRILAERQPKFSPRAREAIRTADAEAIAAELRRPVIEEGFVEGLSTSRDPAVAQALIGVLRAPEFPTTGRNAAAHALQRILALREPPIDPVEPGPIDARAERDLRNAVVRSR